MDNEALYQSHNQVLFKGIGETKVKQAFLDVHRHFTGLHGHRIVVKQKNLKHSTMQAQPLLVWPMSKSKRTYVIHVSNISSVDQYTRMADLPPAVLRGWFAHELGHICDYRQRSVVGLMLFLIRYLTSTVYRKAAEQRADHFAVRHGFAPDIISTKRYILNHRNLSDKYKRQIEKYYLHPDQIEKLTLEELEELP